MRKLINDPEEVVAEALAGLAASHPRTMRLVEGANVVARRVAPISGKVGVVIGGGSGHEPLFSGFVGEGMADAAACGAVFTSPSPDVILKATEAANGGAGVIFVVANYAGDNMNFGLAAEVARAQGIPTRLVRVWDDVASGPPDQLDDRRGTAGYLLVLKAVGASAERGDPLDEVERIAIKARDGARSIGIALSSCSLPGATKPLFEMENDEMHLGMGIHGESGVDRLPLLRADEATDVMLERIVRDLDFTASEAVLVVNGYGGTTTMELQVVARRALEKLAEQGIEVFDAHVGSFCTSMEMAGASITLVRLDDELKILYLAPANSPGFRFVAPG